MSLVVKKRTAQRLAGRIKRKARLRQKIKGTEARPRLNIFKGSKHFNVQFIDDKSGKTLLCLNSISKEYRGKYPVNIEGAKKFASVVAEKANSAGIKNVVFDRNGYKYHGVLAAFADTIREKGINF